MNAIKLICLPFLMLLVLYQCNSKINSNSPKKTEKPNNIISEKSDTISFCGYDLISQDFTDTSSQYRITHSPENNLFIYEDLKHNNIREVEYDSVGLSQVTYWSSNGVVKDKIFIQYNENGKIQQIDKYRRGYDSLELMSIEKYSYSEGLIKELYFLDYQWLGNQVGNHKFLRETIISYDYDDLDRKRISIVKIKKNDKYTTLDTVKYFYDGDATLPYEVHRNLENGAKYFITSQSINTLKIEKVIPDEDGYYIQTDSLTFDNRKRVIEYLTNERLEPQRFPHAYYKYEITYPVDSNLTQVPNLVFPFNPLFPKRNISSLIESIVNPGVYKDAQIRTDIDYNYIPKTVFGYRSDDGKNWTQKSRLILHE